MIESIVKAFYSIIVNLTGILYNWICDLFDIFYFLCGIQLFSDSDYNNIVQKVYVILGLVMMFVLVYSLLLAVIDPDKFAKGENSFPKLIQNVIVSLIIIVVLPTVFNAAFSFQNSLLKYEVIPKLILGDTSDLVKVEGINDPDTISMPKMNVDGVDAPGGRAVAFYTFKTFLTYDMNNDDNKCESDYETCRDAVKAERANLTLADVDSAVLASSRDFSHYSMFSGALYDGQLKFDFFISIAAAIFIIYVLLNFCFDMALRVIKLAFYQIIAPVPVICRIIPGGKFKDVFSKWVKQVISLFIEVFVRILAITMGVYLIALIADKFNSGIPSLEGLSILKKQIVLALLIMSVVMFIKQIPKIIGDLFGLDTGGMKLDLREKLKDGGFFAAGSAIGSLITSRGNPLAAVRGWKAGMKNGNFHSIGAEASNYRSRRDALQQGGALNFFKDSLRRTFGFESSNKADEYAIENEIYTVKDKDGNELKLTPDVIKQLEKEKFDNSVRIGEMNTEKAEIQNISNDNATVISSRGTFKSDGLEEIHKKDSEIREKLSVKGNYTEKQRELDLEKLDDLYTTPGSTMSDKEYNNRRQAIMNRTHTTLDLVGNYHSLSQQLEKNYNDGVISNEEYDKAVLELANIEKSMQEKFVTAATKVEGERYYVNYDGTRIEVDAGGKFETNYQKLLSDLAAGIIKDKNGNVVKYDIMVDNNGKQVVYDENGTALEGWELINSVFKKASSINNELATDLYNRDRAIREVEQANKIIDGYFEQKSKQQEQARNATTYKARKTISEYNDKNNKS